MTFTSRELVGYIGSIILLVGVFTPILTVPIMGSLTYLNNGKGDGSIVLVLALVSAGLVFAKRFKWLWATGLASLTLISYSFFKVYHHLSSMKEEMRGKLGDNPFNGLAEMMMDSIQLQWGWALLFIGAGLIILAAAIKAQPVTAS